MEGQSLGRGRLGLKPGGKSERHNRPGLDDRAPGEGGMLQRLSRRVLHGCPRIDSALLQVQFPDYREGRQFSIESNLRKPRMKFTPFARCTILKELARIILD